VANLLSAAFKTKILAVSTCLAASLATSQCVMLAYGASQENNHEGRLVSPETQARLRDVDRRRKELQEHLSQAREKEKLALIQLSRIKTRLNAATGALVSSKHKLSKTVSKLSETERNLNPNSPDSSILFRRRGAAFASNI